MINSMQQYLEEDVPNLYDRLKESIKDREQTEEMILKQIQDEFTAVQEKLVEEKQMREEGEELLLNRIKEIRARVQDQISLERQERERTEETMIYLLEQTCTKLNAVRYDMWYLREKREKSILANKFKRLILL